LSRFFFRDIGGTGVCSGDTERILYSVEVGSFKDVRRSMKAEGFAFGASTYALPDSKHEDGVDMTEETAGEGDMTFIKTGDGRENFPYMPGKDTEIVFDGFRRSDRSCETCFCHRLSLYVRNLQAERFQTWVYCLLAKGTILI